MSETAMGPRSRTRPVRARTRAAAAGVTWRARGGSGDGGDPTYRQIVRPQVVQIGLPVPTTKEVQLPTPRVQAHLVPPAHPRSRLVRGGQQAAPLRPGADTHREFGVAAGGGGCVWGGGVSAWRHEAATRNDGRRLREAAGALTCTDTS